MVKVFALIPRRPDVTEHFFHEHWAGPHAELAKRITTLRRYVQSHRIATEVVGLPDAIYEGIAEVWFDDVATAAGMGEDPDYAEHAHLDEPNFIDVDRLGFVIADEVFVRAGGPVAQEDGGAKLMLLLARPQDSEPAAFASALREAAASVAQAVPDAERVTVATAVPVMYADGAEPPFDGIIELWFADAEALRSAWTSAGDVVISVLDEVADHERSATFPAEELRVIWPQAAGV